MPPSPVVTLATLKLEPQRHGDRFEAHFAAIAAPAGATRLGSRLIEIPAGKRGWPLHCHHANDEIFVILSGSGQLRLGAETYAVAAGDVVVCPAGGPGTAHQLIAGKTEALRYVAVSTMNEPDIMEYPDSGKLVAFVGAAPGGDKARRALSFTGMKDAQVDYWEGEV